MDRIRCDSVCATGWPGRFIHCRRPTSIIRVGCAARLAPHNYTGFAAHWNKNANFGNAFDQWFLNLFPRDKPFVSNDGGYLTLSFIPTLGTMILGLVAEAGCARRLRKFRSRSSSSRARSACCWAAAALHGHLPGGETDLDSGLDAVQRRRVLLFPGRLQLDDRCEKWLKKWAFPLVVIGMNSIAAYLIAHLFEGSLPIRSASIWGPISSLFRRGLQPFLNGARCCWSIGLSCSGCIAANCS